MPLVSVLIPVYNAERYVRAAVRSILDQDFRDLEVICVDDGSKDGSLAVLRELEREDARVKIISRPNTGICGALNDAIAASNGELLARMDADDISLPGRITAQVNYLREHPECLAVGADAMAVDPDGDELVVLIITHDHESIDQRLLRGLLGLIHPVVMMRRSAVVEAGGYRREFQDAEDLDLFLRMAEKGKLANLPVVYLHYRQHLASVGHLRHRAQRRVIAAVIAEAHRRRGLTDPPECGLSMEVTGSEFEHRLRWAWWAMKLGRPRTARKHAWRCLRLKPWSPQAWRLVYCAVRGR